MACIGSVLYLQLAWSPETYHYGMLLSPDAIGVDIVLLTLPCPHVTFAFASTLSILSMLAKAQT